MKYLQFIILFCLIVQKNFAQNTLLLHQAGIVGDTKITMADGSEKRITEIKAGDNIRTVNVDSTRPTIGFGKVKKLVALTGTKCIEIISSNKKGLICTNNLSLLAKYVVGECQEYGKGEHVIIAKKHCIWATQNTHSTAVLKLQIGMELCYFKQNYQVAEHIKAIKNYEKLSHKIYTLELENGNAFIANGYVVKCNEQ